MNLIAIPTLTNYCFFVDDAFRITIDRVFPAGSRTNY